jgi:hypothetical protein
MTYDGPDRRNGRATLDTLSFQLGRVEGCVKATVRGLDKCEGKIDKLGEKVQGNALAIAGLKSGARKTGAFWGGIIGALVAAAGALFKLLGGGD